MREQVSPISFLVHVTRLPQKGMPVTVTATEKQRIALAREHGLEEVRDFTAELLVTPWKRRGVNVTGRIAASIVQACVVTLDPIEAAINEDISAVFLPDDSRLSHYGQVEGGELNVDPDGEDAPEVFSGDTIDVGALAEEHFGLAIDPYPRKPGADAPTETEAAPTEKRQPFAALAALKRPQ